MDVPDFALEFKYDANHNRYYKKSIVAGETIETRYFKNLYERNTNLSNGEIEHKHFIYADGKLIALNTQTRSRFNTLKDKQIRYLHYDALNSVDLITDGYGEVVERRSFDPWGKKRAVRWEEQNSLHLRLVTNRGFTGHEHIEEVGLIHMNGRVYDQQLGRFMSADPVIQAPFVTNSFNRYSYVNNNPLKYTDPTGFSAQEFTDVCTPSDDNDCSTPDSNTNSNGSSSDGKNAEAGNSIEPPSNNKLSSGSAAPPEKSTKTSVEVGNGNATITAANASKTSTGDVSSLKDVNAQKGLSAKGEELLKSIEELRLNPYNDQTGKGITSWVKGATIGYGHLISKSEWSSYKNGITAAQANTIFSADLAPFVSAVNSVLTVSVSQQQFDAGVMLAYNIGVSAFSDSSAVALINHSSASTPYSSVEGAWKAWNRSQGSVSQGLINRRDAEWNIYSNGVYKKW